MPHSRLIAALAFAALAACPAAHASQVIHLDTRALTRESSDIVIGTVGEQHAHWNAAHTMIVTDVTIRVSQALKGGGGDLTLTQVGGEVDGLRYAVEGSASFRGGEDVLVFAWRDGAGRAQVDGLGQGKFEIRRDPVSGTRMVQRAALALAIGNAKTLRAAPLGAPARAVALDDMVREIQAAMAEVGR